jgi:hypothetical protein
VKVFVAALAAFSLKLFLAAYTLGTNDARTWEHDLTTLRTAGFAELYRSGVQYHSPTGRQSQRQAFIHPPAVLHALRIFGNRFWLRAVCAVADAGTLALLSRMFGGVPLIVILSPISILISGFHGNTDPIMMFFLVLAVFFAERGSGGRSGLAFGLACSVKLIPLVFAPAILLCLTRPRLRLKWIAVSLGLWIALSLPYLAHEPSLILRSIIGYSGATGLWGLSLLSIKPYDVWAKWIALFAAALLPLLLKKRLFERCGLIAFLFLFLSPAFGLQYLAWTVPWSVSLHRSARIAWHAVAGATALAVYTAAAGKTPARTYADLLNPAHFPALILMGIVCWIAIGANMAILWADRSPVLPATHGDRGNIAATPHC